MADRSLPHSSRTGYYGQDADGSYDLFVMVNSADVSLERSRPSAVRSAGAVLLGSCSPA
ncbi:hypothetical protein ACFVJM_30200 [Streptomyces virginiae]|uniref:hypothetical protein n=1 Tax=Streptomyces virginiae TaxID=1961 RepID=UPI00362634F9